MKTKLDVNSEEAQNKKERHIVSWSQEEDDILRDQIRTHGTENWTIIASKFKDKTTRQCRRRWYTYLNSDFKKGGWSPEEDMLLCEAQKIFGNRWTEIAKVVSGRTDNAVKNRFSTLCKKRAKHEALAKENDNSRINSNKKRVASNRSSTTSVLENASSSKKIRRDVSDSTESHSQGEMSQNDVELKINPKQRPPFSVLVQNIHSLVEFPVPAELHTNIAGNDKVQETFLKRDDPRIIALIQQAELLSSLAAKVNEVNTEQSLENAWKVVQEFLNQGKGDDHVNIKLSDVQFQLDSFKETIEDLRSSNEDCLLSWRQTDLHEESSGSSEYSSGSTIPSQPLGDLTETGVSCTKPSAANEDNMPSSEVFIGEEKQCLGGSETEVQCFGNVNGDILPTGNEVKGHDGVISSFTNTEFRSPLHVTPIFKALSAGIPSPKFSESERQFLLRTLGLESPSANPSTIPPQIPTCKRALLQSL
ncbi:transcription factor MYB124-like [Impatiens glandulifera]|uniref:transcription factor MYB124-like n=1 Tax=Impatiens glandulifera TaxID=253017 RepID=UPI001FB1626B|nr:transcription factor MYB124-like [Impatiens glandulifera]